MHVMKNNQKISELQKYANYAKADGIACRKSKNAGGWVELANACGAENITTRSEAREFCDTNSSIMGVRQI
jgi:hypothetical protein